MKLYNYQIENLNKVKDETRVAFYWDMGTGKTFVGSEKLSQLNNTRNLVVCQKSKIDDWVDHFKTHYPKYQVYDLSKRAVGGHDCIKDLLAYDKKFKIGVINYDLVWRRSELLRIKDFVLMLDESSLIQNDTAKRSKFILELGKNASGVILLSGTPIGGKYENLWSQMHLLGWNISKKMYQNQYLEYEYLDGLTKSIPIITGYKNVNRLKRKMDKYNCQFLKADEVTDLPEQVFVPVKLDDTLEYRKFRKDSIVEVADKELVGGNTLTKMLYERQLCSVYDEKRIEKVKDLIDSTNESIIVFYNFDAELEQIKTIGSDQKHEVGVICGFDKSGKDMLNYSLNHNYRYTPILAIQYQSGSMGLNLQSFARRIIYYSLPLSSELFEQSKKRIHRIGQKQKCFYYILMSKNSIEEQIYRTLKKRNDYTQELFKKGW